MNFKVYIILLIFSSAVVFGEQRLYEVTDGENSVGVALWEWQETAEQRVMDFSMDLELEIFTSFKYVLDCHLQYDLDNRLNVGYVELQIGQNRTDYRFTQDNQSHLQIEKNKKSRGWKIQNYKKHRGTTFLLYNPPAVKELIENSEDSLSLFLLDVETDRVRPFKFKLEQREDERWGSVWALVGDNMLFLYEKGSYRLLYSWAKAMGFESEAIFIGVNNQV